jgi:acyl dehydratase
LNRLSFTELAVGARFTSHRRTVTETDHQLFMMLIGDWSPIHADAEYARLHGPGKRIVHGGLGIALTMGLQTAALEFADPLLGALGIADWAFKAPLFIDDTIFVEVEILDKRITSSGNKYIVQRKLRLIKTDGALCQEGTASALVALPAGAAT